VAYQKDVNQNDVKKKIINMNNDYSKIEEEEDQVELKEKSPKCFDKNEIQTTLALPNES
jgi:hypothetical protein